jgi:hypothetical protein
MFQGWLLSPNDAVFFLFLTASLESLSILRFNSFTLLPYALWVDLVGFESYDLSDLGPGAT